MTQPKTCGQCDHFARAASRSEDGACMARAKLGEGGYYHPERYRNSYACGYFKPNEKER